MKKLNLFHNLLDVGGARLLGEALKVNNSLEDLDIGYNRIKKAGLRKIIDALKANKNSNLKYLGLKYNFIGENILSEFIKALNKKEYSNLKLEKISMKDIHYFLYIIDYITILQLIDNMEKILKIFLRKKIPHIE